MTTWLDPVTRALDDRAAPLSVFVRDDDAGWSNERLFALLDVFARRALPIDLAVIPTAVGAPLANALLERLRRGERIGLHQHGYRHANHEVSGRPCEFGPSRTLAMQYRDLVVGHWTLREWFGARLEPFFTPPWNRCTRDTGAALRRAGMTVISRDRSAGPLDIDGVLECPIDVDWFARRRGERLAPDEWTAALAAAIRAGEPRLGLMLHHAGMGDDELAWLEGLLDVLASHVAVRWTLMRDIAGDAVPAERRARCARS